MSDKSLRLFDKIVMAILGFFPFFSGCDEPREMYGTPTADYQIIGTVTDSLTNSPVKDIRVSLKSQLELNTPSDTVFTDAAGKYSFYFKSFPFESQSISLKVEDIDGETNGGPYLAEEGIARVTATSLDGSKANGWYSGKITAIKDFKLKK